ncbi:extracellular solute-binding protein [Gracilibacillus phocaeensis]|uniref:extracellular solute-binding protein n=1 Tax=Gracilibacillus phocaeensis TaxID=2042304 RepID=UPI00102F4B5A|nr:ABC transporter substrate-binding protein [Gracilibacillus phocaeensis]
MRKASSLLLTAILALSTLAACQNNTGNQDSESGTPGVTEIDFWAATNPPQEAFWKKVADEFNEENDDIHVNVSQMQESPTSEASVQSAIAGGEAPTFSENINRGFAAQLANSQALVPLNEVEGFDELIESRNMAETIESWEFSDGSQYVLPIYSNAMLFAWRTDILQDLGFDDIPENYSDVLEVVEALKASDNEKFLWAKPDLGSPEGWTRWFDFFMLYNGASDGNNFVEGNELIADDEAGKAVLEFMSQLEGENALLTSEASDPFETGLGIFSDLGPWSFPYWSEQFPEMVYGETFELSGPPVPDGMSTDNVKTFADAKGIVFYASATEEEQAAAMEFLTWVYSDPERDLQWFEETNMPPARDDLTSNESFNAFLEENPALIPYAEAVPNGVPPIDNPNYNDIQTQIGEQAFNPVVRGEKDPEQAWKDMKQAIEGELQNE